MKILFLDIDGVLIPQRACYLAGQTPIFTKFDPVAVALFNKIQKNIPELRTVIHSTWSKSVLWKSVMPDFVGDLPDYLRGQGLELQFHDDWTTPKKMSSNRWDEIKFWLDDHPEIDKYVIVDDDMPTPYFKINTVRTDYNEGFIWRSFADVLDKLDYKMSGFFSDFN